MNTKNDQAPEMEIEEADLEQLAKADKPVPKARRYRIRVDDSQYVTEKPKMTGREILTLASKNPPESFILTEKLRGGRLVTVGLDDVVDFTTPGIERFTTLPREVQEG